MDLPSPPINAEQVRELTDETLLQSLQDLVRRSASLTAAVLVHLGEVEVRGLHLGLGHSSVFTYCTQALGFFESAAYKRIQVARLCRRLPVVLDAVQSGRVHLSGLCVLGPHLDESNVGPVLAEAAGRSKRELEALAERLRSLSARRSQRGEPVLGHAETLDLFAGPSGTHTLVADLAEPAPLPDPAPAPVGLAPAASAPADPVRRASGARSDARRITVVATPRLLERLERARALLAHTVPYGDTTAVLERALDVLVATLEKRRFGVGARPCRAAISSGTSAPQSGPSRSRRPIPIAVRRAVYARDGGRCAFVGSSGHRCGETRALELHHRHAHARGGPDTVDNLALRCRSHNQHEARLDFGEEPARVAGSRRLAPVPRSDATGSLFP